MLVVETVAKIRREHFARGKGVKTIAREMGLSRNTVRKILRSGDTALEYERREQPHPKLGPFIARLEALLEANASGTRKDRLTLMRITDLLSREGYDGGYDAVRRYAGRWSVQRRGVSSPVEAFVPLSFAPGDAYQFDWSHEQVEIGGTPLTVKVAHVRLCHSRRFYIRAYPRETQEMVFDAHARAFQAFGGVTRRGIYDNMRTAVDRVRRGKERDVNARFAAMVSHFLFEAEFCNPASGWEKGQVEKNVQDARRRLWQVMPAFPDIDELNAWLEAHCIAQWGQIQHGVLPGTIADAHAAEVASLMPLGRPFDGFVEHAKRVSPTCLISFERNRYSVPASFANRPVSVRIYPERIAIAAEGQILCEHERVIQRSHDLPGRTIYDWRHYLAVVQRKPGALRNGAPFTEMPAAFRQLQGQLLRHPGGDKEMVEILSLVLHHDEQAVLRAVELALEAGVATKTHILNILHRLIDGKDATPPRIDAPQALILRREPKANVARYDTLRNKDLRHAS